MKKGESARIHAFNNKAFALRLLSIGVRPESTVTLVRRSPLRDALYIKVDNQSIAVRKNEAKSISLKF